MKSNQQRRVKVFAAVVGGCGILAMGAVSVALHDERAPGVPGGVATGTTFIQGGDMTLGQTATTTTPPTAPETSVAAPPVKAPPYGGG